MQVETKTAEFLAKWGWPVVPVPYGPLRPSDIEALVACAADDAETARSLFQAAPGHAIGVPLGHVSQTFALRVEGSAGIEAFYRLAQAYGELPSSIRTRAGSETEYIWLQLPLGYAVASQRLAEGLDVLGEGEIVLAPPLLGPRSWEWTFDPRYSDLDWPPKWLIELVARPLPPEARQEEGSARAMCRALTDAAFAVGARREDELLRAASVIAGTTEVGRLSPAEGYLQLLRSAEHNGLSREPRWAQLQPLLMAKLRTATKLKESSR